MNLTQRQLRMFVTTAALTHISRASEALHISQPALTRALKEFETQLGAPLFVRTTRRLSLSAEGERFLPVAQRLLHDLQQAADTFQEQASGQQGMVTLAVGTAFGCTVLPGVLQAFVQSHPQVRVRVVDDNSAGITRRVAHSEVDFGIGSPVGDRGTLQYRKLLSAPLGLLAHPAHYRLKAWARADELGQWPLLKESADTSIMHMLRTRGSGIVAQMDEGVEVSSLALQLALVRAGVGIAVLSALGASHREAQDLKFAPLRPAVAREVFVITPQGRAPSPAAKALVDAIVQGTAQASLHPSIKRWV